MNRMRPARHSRLGLGLAALGRPGYINLGHDRDLPASHTLAAMEAHSHAVLDAAWAAGIRYFDAARSYGRAEHFLARWLRARGIAPGEVTVGSKWGYRYTADWQVQAAAHEIKEHSLRMLQQQWPESRALLAPHLDLYQIHSATFQSGVLRDEAVLDRLAALRDEGLHIGLSLSGAQQGALLARALEVERGGRPLFSAVQATWNLLERSAGPMLAVAHGAGLFVIVKETLANGRLTPRNGAPDFAPQMALLQQEARRLDSTVDALALAAVVAQPWADVALSGAATVPHLQANARAIAVPWDEAAAAALAPLAEASPYYWARRSALAWN